ncbi:hypothetical protein HDU97_009536 [Phlyctochytrium planicorne]|nr:hypothetical protein HDU97_009536 [Phlyctochytrium planicorne]
MAKALESSYSFHQLSWFENVGSEIFPSQCNQALKNLLGKNADLQVDGASTQAFSGSCKIIVSANGAGSAPLEFSGTDLKNFVAQLFSDCKGEAGNVFPSTLKSISGSNGGGLTISIDFIPPFAR